MIFRKIENLGTFDKASENCAIKRKKKGGVSSPPDAREREKESTIRVTLDPLEIKIRVLYRLVGSGARLPTFAIEPLTALEQ